MGVLGGAIVGALLPILTTPKAGLGRRLAFHQRAAAPPCSATVGVSPTACWLVVCGLGAVLRAGTMEFGCRLGPGGSWRGCGLPEPFAGRTSPPTAACPGCQAFKQRFSLPLTFKTGGVFERVLFFRPGAGRGLSADQPLCPLDAARRTGLGTPAGQHAGKPGAGALAHTASPPQAHRAIRR